MGVGFNKSGSSDSYVLLGGGGHKLVSDFAGASHSHSQYLPITGGTITGKLTVNDGCFLCGAKANNAHVNISDSVQIVKTFESHNPYLLFHIPNVNWARIEFNGSFHFRSGMTDGSYMSLYAASFNQGSDIRKKNIIDDVNINIYDIANAPLFKFTWKKENRYSGLHIGSSAQYWQTILPELVSTKNDAEQTLSMQYDVIALASTVTVAKKIVELEQDVNILKSENQALRKQIEELKTT